MCTVHIKHKNNSIPKCIRTNIYICTYIYTSRDVRYMYIHILVSWFYRALISIKLNILNQSVSSSAYTYIYVHIPSPVRYSIHNNYIRTSRSAFCLAMFAYMSFLTFLVCSRLAVFKRMVASSTISPSFVIYSETIKPH